MNNDGETPEQRRERLRQDELKNNSGGNLRDASGRAGGGSLTDLTGGLGSKGLGILILIIMIVAAIGFLIFN
ncbi:hypothetical protein FO441_06310 [Salinicoccus cyprini]|uniref:Uncharacterized protein n=1 Tax=Salinicoccus cyprini TaxID=2493691 RepID=A0A558AUU6_9STAP|nr:DUF6366 family protein [Salinicoccus cyprini]TVT28025.1 hypothetical protein FO441_06310 [Salinicoccus cyprini]